jgi:hypothetical protein
MILNTFILNSMEMLHCTEDCVVLGTLLSTLAPTLLHFSFKVRKDNVKEFSEIPLLLTFSP